MSDTCVIISEWNYDDLSHCEIFDALTLNEELVDVMQRFKKLIMNYIKTFFLKCVDWEKMY